MNYDIISIGDARFLADVLNAVAMIFATSSVGAMMKMGLILSVIVILFQGLMKGGSGINVSHIFISAIIINGFLVPKVNGVKVIDSYSGYVSVIDNVPIGIAFTGTVISSVGYKMTQLFEVAYQPIQSATSPQLTKQPFLESLKALNNLRAQASAQGMWDAANRAVNSSADMKGSWTTYIQECTFNKLTNGTATMAQLFNQSYRTALRPDTASENLWTAINVNGTETPTTCIDAYNTLFNEMAKVPVDANFVEQLTASLGVRNYNDTTSTGMTSVESSTKMLLNAQVTASELVMMSMIEPVLYTSSAKSMSPVDTASAMMINEARQKRNIAWAADQTLFNTIARPAMSFFEAFCYAITPIMAFVLTLGPSGLNIALKYFSLNIWVQLWLPMMSIVNYFLCMVTSRNVAEFSNYSNYNFDSFYSLNTATDIAANWIAVGGMLGAAVPPLALMLLYGGATTANSIAGRLRADSDVNTSYTQPSASNTAPVLNSSSMHTGTPNLGAASSSLRATDFSIGGTSNTGIAMSALNSSVTSSAAAVMTGSSSSSGYTNASSMSDMETRSIGANILANSSKLSSTAQSSLNSFMQTYSNSNQTQEQLATIWALGGKVSGKTPKGGKFPGLGGEFAVTNNSQESGTHSSGNETSTTDVKGYKFDQADSLQMARSLTEAISKTSSDGTTHSNAFNDLKSRADSFTKTDQHQQSFAKQANAAESFGTTSSIQVADFSNFAATRDEKTRSANQAEVDSFLSTLSPSDRQNFENIQRSTLQQLGPKELSGSEARNTYSQIAALNALSKSKDPNTGMPSEAAVSAIEHMSSIYNRTKGLSFENNQAPSNASLLKYASNNANTANSVVDNKTEQAPKTRQQISNEGATRQNEVNANRGSNASVGTDAGVLLNQGKSPDNFYKQSEKDVKDIARQNQKEIVSNAFQKNRDKAQTRFDSSPSQGYNLSAIVGASSSLREMADSSYMQHLSSLWYGINSGSDEMKALMQAKTAGQDLISNSTSPSSVKENAAKLVEGNSKAMHDNSLSDEFYKNPEGYSQYIKNELAGNSSANSEIKGIDQNAAKQMAAGAIRSTFGDAKQLLSSASTSESNALYKEYMGRQNQKAKDAGYTSKEAQDFYVTAAENELYSTIGGGVAGTAIFRNPAVAIGAVAAGAEKTWERYGLDGQERLDRSAAAFKLTALRDRYENPTELSSYKTVPGSDGTWHALDKNSNEHLFTFTKDNYGFVNSVTFSDQREEAWQQSLRDQTMLVSAAGGNGSMNHNTLIRAENTRYDVKDAKRNQ